MVGSRSYSWTAAKLNRSKLPTEVANMESIKNDIKKSIVTYSHPQQQPAAAVPQRFLLKMNREHCVDTAAADVIIVHWRNYLC